VRPLRFRRAGAEDVGWVERSEPHHKRPRDEWWGSPTILRTVPVDPPYFSQAEAPYGFAPAGTFGVLSSYLAANWRTWLTSRGLTGRNCGASTVATATVWPVSVMNSTS